MSRNTRALPLLFAVIVAFYAGALAAAMAGYDRLDVVLILFAISLMIVGLVMAAVWWRADARARRIRPVIPLEAADLVVPAYAPSAAWHARSEESRGRVRPKLIKLASAVSFLLLITTAALWEWSSIRPIWFSWGNSTIAAEYTLHVGNSRVEVQHWTGRRAIPRGPDESLGAANYSGWVAFGFAHQRFDAVKRNTSGVITGVYGDCTASHFRLAWPLLLSFPLSARVVWLHAVRGTKRRRRIRRGSARPADTTCAPHLTVAPNAATRRHKCGSYDSAGLKSARKPA